MEKTTVSDIQRVILERMRNYEGDGGKGINGVWNAIDPEYKYPTDMVREGLKDEYGNTRIKKEAFSRAVSRLRQPPKNEKMNFGMRGNILLTLNILEILGLFDRSKLLEVAARKKNIKGVIVNSDKKLTILNRKLDNLSLSLEMAFKRVPRFTAYKISHDFQIILYRINELLNNNIGQSMPSFENRTELSSNIKKILSVLPSRSRYTFLVYTVFRDFEEYFYQDKILFRFLTELNNTHMESWQREYQIPYSPLYLLYFFLKMNKRFLTMISRENIDLFAILNKTTYDEVLENQEIVENEVIINLMRDQKPAIFIQKTNTAIYKTTKRLIEFFRENEDKMPNNINIFEETKSYTKRYIDIFYNIYINKTRIDEKSLNAFLKKHHNNTLKDTYSLMTIGYPIGFYLSEKHIEDIIEIRNKLSDYTGRLIRDSRKY